MATQARKNLTKRALTMAGKVTAWFALIVGIFMLTAWIGSSIPRNSDWEAPDANDPQTVTLMLETNGIHTGIIMPLVSPDKDWREVFPRSDLPNPNRPYTHISVSWGEREVFLNTPTWSDLTLSAAIGAAFGGDGLLHVAHYVRPITGEDVKTLRITRAQYRALVADIESLVPPNPATREVNAGYGSYDVFYDSAGTYHLGNTCNQWTADRLANAGIETALWSPFPGGVMKWAD